MPRRDERELNEIRKYPICSMFGEKPRRLTVEEATTVTPDRRIESVWLFLIRKTLRFVDSLYGTESANCDVEDVLVELYIELKKKDAKWEPERGRYITFAAKIAQRHLSSLRDKLRTVQSPRNSLSRLQRYEREISEGTITDERRETYRFIKSAYLPYGDSADLSQAIKLNHRSGQDVETETDVFNRESGRLANDAVTWGLMALTTFESRVLGMCNGLYGQPSLTVTEIAERTGKSRDEVKKARDEAVRKVKDRLLAMGHPAVASEN